MRILNTKKGAVTIAGLYTIAAGASRDFDDTLWTELRERKAVKFWLERGDLKEYGLLARFVDDESKEIRTVAVDASALAAQYAQAETKGALSGDELRTLEGAEVERHPLDHDGDGKPGGSLPKSKRKARA